MGDPNGMDVDEGNTGVGGLVPSENLIGYGGRIAMKESAGGKAVLEGRADIFDYVKEFKSKHTLNGDGRLPILKLMQLGGMSQEGITHEIMAKLVENLRELIPKLSQANLAILNEHCLSYLTVPELSSIPILVLERLRVVQISTWQDIVDNGLDHSPYINLPTSLKRKIWHVIPHAFDHEIDALIGCVKPFVEPVTEPIENCKARSVVRFENTTLTRLRHLIGTDEDLLVTVIDKLVDISAAESTPGLRLAYANLLADLMCTFSRIAMPNVELLRQMALSLDVGGDSPAGAALNASQVAAIRNSLADPASCGPVALLVGSAYTRDLVMGQIVELLIGARENLPKKLTPADLTARAAKLRAVPMLRDIAYIAASCIRARDVLRRNVPLEEAEVDQCFERFFPFLCREAFIDDLQVRDSFYSCNARAPHNEMMIAAVKGPFERKVLVQYAFVLFSHGNVVPLSKLRIILDTIVQRADPAEEAKEVFLANDLIMQIMDA